MCINHFYRDRVHYSRTKHSRTDSSWCVPISSLIGCHNMMESVDLACQYFYPTYCSSKLFLRMAFFLETQCGFLGFTSRVTEPHGYLLVLEKKSKSKGISHICFNFSIFGGSVWGTMTLTAVKCNMYCCVHFLYWYFNPTWEKR